MSVTKRLRRFGDSLERRLLLLVAAVALPLLGVAAFAVRDAFSTERARAEDRLQTRARAMAVLVDREIGRVEALLRTAARSESLRSGDVKGFLTEAEAVAAELGGAWVGVTERDGTRLLNTFWPNGAPPPGSRGSETASLALSTGRTAVSNLIQDTRAGERTPVIVVAAPVTSSAAGGASGYAVTAAVRVDTLGAVLRELELSEGWVGAVLDGGGTIVARTVRPGDTVGLRARPSVLDALASGHPTGIVHGVRTLEDTLAVVAYARMPRTGYAALVAVPEEVFAAPLRMALVRTVAIGGALALAGLLLALATARQLARAMGRLVDSSLGTGLSNIREIDAVARRLAASDAERGRAERELRVARDEAVEILESIDDGFYALDSDRRVAYVNSRALQTFGKRREDLLGRRFDEVFPGAEGSPVTLILHEVASRAEPREFEVDAPLQGRWTAFSAYPRRGGGVSVYFRDVSARRAAEAALRESEEQFRATFEQAAVGIAHVGLDGRWLRANRRLCEITGYPMDVLLRLGFQDITHPDDLDADLDQVRALLAGEIGSSRMEKRYLRPDGSSVWTLLTVSLLRPSTGDAAPYFVSVVEDISELKRTEAARRESERRYRFLAENNPQIVWTARPDGLLDYFNHRWTEVTGLPVEAGTGDGWASAIHPDDLLRMNAAWARSLATGEPYAVEHRVLTRDGAWRWFRTQAAALRAADGDIQMWVGTAADVQDEREALEQVRRLNAELEHRVVERTAQLADANAELESFAYSVAHDLRAPLRGMQGFSRALLEDHADALDETGRDYAGRIARGAERLDDLINDLLAYSRLSREEIRPEPVELEELLADMLRHMEPQIEQARAAIQLEHPLPVVIGQRAVLTQVLMNLLGNAIKFVPPGAEPRVRVWAEHRGSNAQIWVEDNGIGIRPEHLDKIFRVFERLHGQKAYPGTGIGLAIVKKGVERLGGTVGVVSEAGHGSRFWFELPKEKPGHGHA